MYATKISTSGRYRCRHTAGEFKGAGIGFVNMRRGVNRHGKHVWVDVRESRGAIFFSLPRLAEANNG
jgi:signal transduction histidine kinase